jgi:hypothetical protein
MRALSAMLLGLMRSTVTRLGTAMPFPLPDLRRLTAATPEDERYFASLGLMGGFLLELREDIHYATLRYTILCNRFAACRQRKRKRFTTAAPHQAPRRLAQLGVLLPDQHPFHPGVKLLAVFGLKLDFLTGLDKPANRFQTQLFCCHHANVHYPA